MTLPVSAQRAFEWHTRDGAFERLRPPWQAVRIIERAHGVEAGQRMVMHVRLGPVWWRWVAVHGPCEPGTSFVDEQVEGPFRSWRHLHRFEPANDGSCIMTDRVEYALPLGTLGEALAGDNVARRLDRLFAFRHRRTADDLARHAAYADRPPLRVLISGASGMIGAELEAFLGAGGHRVLRLVRRGPQAEDEILWDPAAGTAPDPGRLEDLDAVINLAGASIAGGRWTPARRRLIEQSRVGSTRLLVDTLLRLQRPPKTLLSASAIGYYGDCGDGPATEESPPGPGFLPSVCTAWETEAGRATAAGIRVVTLRTALVFSGRGGVLTTLLPPFRAALGGPVGGGRQWVSWISLEDWLGAALHILYDESLEGPVNLTSPAGVTNRELTEAIGRALRRPEKIPLPAAVIRAAFGEMGKHLLLEGCRVVPAKLQATGFRFLYPQLDDALRVELGLPAP